MLRSRASLRSAAVGLVCGLMLALAPDLPAVAQPSPPPNNECDNPNTVSPSCLGRVPRPDPDLPQPCVRTYQGATFPCSHPDWGRYVGTVELFRFLRGTDTVSGCWRGSARSNFDYSPVVDFTAFMDHLSPDEQGRWYTTRCWAGEATWPSEPSLVGLSWFPDSEVGPTAEELVLRALARVTILAPPLRLNPPTTGSVLIGMPQWLAVEETPQTWGPLTPDPECDSSGGFNLCVTIAVRAVSVVWNPGDGSDPRVCPRERNIAWQPGMDFLSPGNACHHFYTRASRDQPGGTYTLTATTTFEVVWSANDGQGDTIEGVTQACGPDANQPCQATTSVRVEELQALVGGYY